MALQCWRYHNTRPQVILWGLSDKGQQYTLEKTPSLYKTSAMSFRINMYNTCMQFVRLAGSYL